MLRYVCLGQTIKTTARFDDENGNPLPNKDNTKYPFVKVRDSYGHTVTSGVAVFNSETNEYEFTWTCPSNAPVSDESSKWEVEWLFLDQDGKQYIQREKFDVTYPPDVLNAEAEISVIILPIRKATITVPVKFEPNNVSFSVLDLSDNEVFNTTPTNLGFFSNSYFYQAEIPENTLSPLNVYTGLFSFDDNLFFQKIYTVNTRILHFISSLRQLTDKTLKETNTYMGYKDSDIFFSLEKGLELINSIVPLTSWRLTDFFNMIPEWILIQGAEYVLLRQQLLADADYSFSFSSQSVDLSVDRSGLIEAEISRLESWLEGDLKEFKRQTVARQHRPVLGLSYPSVNNASSIRTEIRSKGIPFPF